MKKKPIMIIAVLILLGVFITLAVVSKNKTKLPEVAAAEVTSADFTREVSANGSIVSRKNYQIVSLVSGSVERVLVEPGDRVKHGDILAELNREDMDLEYQNAQASLEATSRKIREELLTLRTAYTQALTAYGQADRDARRTAELSRIGSASSEEQRLAQDSLELAEQNLRAAAERLNFREGRDLDDPRTSPSVPDEEIVEASTEVKQARLQVRTLASALERYTFRAPMDGLVTAVAVEEGGVLAQGSPVAEINNPDNLEVVSSIDEVDLSRIVPGQPVTIESDSFIGEKLEGRVAKIAPVIRTVGDSRTCEIRVDITGDPEGLAVIGASCSIYIIVETRTGVPAIPVESYFIEEGGKFVLILEPTEIPDTFLVKKQTVETGILGIETIEVTRGLAPGDRIAAGRVPGVDDGMEVKIKTEDAGKKGTE